MTGSQIVLVDIPSDVYTPKRAFNDTAVARDCTKKSRRAIDYPKIISRYKPRQRA